MSEWMDSMYRMFRLSHDVFSGTDEKNNDFTWFVSVYLKVNDVK